MPAPSLIDPRRLQPGVGLPFALRAIQYDLGRQLETPDTLRAISAFAADQGFNAVVLYLEGRIRTPAFAQRPAAETWDVDQLAALAADLRALGLQVIPAFNILGHAEHFFAAPQLRPLAEERDGDGRFGPVSHPSTFDWTLPETAAFWRAYLGDILPALQAPVVHIGLDECWNLGFGPGSRARRQAEGIGPLFMDVLHQGRDIVAAHDAQVWIWDDMFEFFPDALEQVPTDVGLCHWHYDPSIADAGASAHFGNRARVDWLGRYQRLGLRAIVCPWYPWNTETLTRYAQSRAVIGGLMTQWEMQTCYLDRVRPAIAYTGQLWQGRSLDPDAAWQRAIAAALPGHQDARHAIRLLSGYNASRPAVQEAVYLNGPLTLGERQAQLAWRLAEQDLARAHQAAETAPDEEQTVSDMLADACLAYSAVDLREWVPQILDPRRPHPAPPHLAATLDRIRQALAAAARYQRPLHDLRRPGCHPVNALGAYHDALQAMIVRLQDALTRAPDPAARWLQLRLCLPDQHGAPRLRVTADGAEIYSGSPKSRGAEDHGIYLLDIPFQSPEPPRELVLEGWGWGEVGICHVAVRSRDGDSRPHAVTAHRGPVHDADALLIDDSLPTRLGHADYHTTILEPERAHDIGRVVVAMQAV